MEKIRLSRNDKKVFRMVMNGIKECPSHFPMHKFVPSLRTLEGKGLVKVTWVSGDIPWSFAPTNKGRSYISENPNLTNPINWEVVGIIISAIISIIALFVSCTNYFTIHE